MHITTECDKRWLRRSPEGGEYPYRRADLDAGGLLSSVPTTTSSRQRRCAARRLSTRGTRSTWRLLWLTTPPVAGRSQCRPLTCRGLPIAHGRSSCRRLASPSAWRTAMGSAVRTDKLYLQPQDVSAVRPSASQVDEAVPQIGEGTQLIEGGTGQFLVGSAPSHRRRFRQRRAEVQKHDAVVPGSYSGARLAQADGSRALRLRTCAKNQKPLTYNHRDAGPARTVGLALIVGMQTGRLPTAARPARASSFQLTTVLPTPGQGRPCGGDPLRTASQAKASQLEDGCSVQSTNNEVTFN